MSDTADGRMSAMSFLAMTVFTGWSLTTFTSVMDSPVSVAEPGKLAVVVGQYVLNDVLRANVTRWIDDLRQQVAAILAVGGGEVRADLAALHRAVCGRPRSAW